MKIAYGTYGMPHTPGTEAVSSVARMGYDGIEIACGPAFPTHPDKLDTSARRAMRDQLADLGLEVPALMLQINFIADDPQVHQQNLAAFKQTAQLGHDLGLNEPIITFTMGGQTAKYHEQRDEFVHRLTDYADAADQAGCVAAVEPHVNGTIDRPDRAVWLIEAVDSPRVRLNFDISHFDLIGLGIDECVSAMTPYSVHTHVKDGHMVDGKVQFLLPGQGDFDYVAYLRAMDAAGWAGHITVEISGQIWNAPGYDPIAAAAESYAALNNAFKLAGLQRG